MVFLKVQVFWYVMPCRNANSSLGNYSHYNRASHPTRQDSSEIIPVLLGRKTFSLTTREKCRTEGFEIEAQKEKDQRGRDGEREREREIMKNLRELQHKGKII